jgi:hypothetical protein
MSRSGQGAGRQPRAVTAAGSSNSAAQQGESGFDGRAALGLVGVGIVGHVLRSRRTYERLIVAAIAVEALRRIGQDNGTSAMTSLKAWEKRQMQRMERKAQRQRRAVKGAAQMARSGPPRGLAGTLSEPDHH